MKETIYIETLRLGAENLEKGITYNQIVDKLTQKGIKIEPYFEEYFMVWFFSNFYERAVTKLVMSQTGTLIKKDAYGSAVNFPVIMTGEAFQNYIDYLDLKEARESSSQAQKTANRSIWIALITLIISTAASIVSILNTLL